jgi:hypothetical protein
MKRDPQISKLMRESGLESAPDDFTSHVMDKLQAVPSKKPFKPLIGRGGRIVIILTIAALVVVAMLFTDPAGKLFGNSISIPRMESRWSQLHFNLDFLKQIHISTGLAAALVAMFLLVLSDVGLNRRRFIQ